MDGVNREEENNNESNDGSWWGSWPSWLQSAKEKSSNALEFMKRDLSEFSHVVQTDAVAAVSSTAAMLKEKLTVDNAEAVADKARQSITSVIGTIADVFAPQKELEDAELMIIKNSEPVAMDWWQKAMHHLNSQLYLIRKDPKTFCHEPEGPPEMYENWLESFDPDEHQEEMTEIMITCSEIRTIYDKLVPTAVSHLEFWQRYFYRVHLLRKAEAKRADLMRRAEQISIEDVEWDEDKEHDIGYPKSIHTGQNLLVDNSTPAKNVIATETNITSCDLNQNQSTCNNELILETYNVVEKTVDSETDIKSVKNNNPAGEPEETVNIETKMDNISASNVNNSVDISSDPPSADSLDGNQSSSSIESLGKESSTGDEWEKDFDLEINENDLKNLNISSNQDTLKEEEDDWEKWQ